MDNEIWPPDAPMTEDNAPANVRAARSLRMATPFAAWPTPTATPNAAPATPLFGAAPAPAVGSIFGTPSSAAGGASLFSGLSTPAASTASSLFSTPSAGLFAPTSLTTPATAATAPALFSLTTPATASTIAGQPQQITFNSNFDSLPAGDKPRWESLEKFMREDRARREELEAHSWLNVIKFSSDADALASRLKSLTGTMEVQYAAILTFKREVLTDMQHADKAKRSYDRGLSVGSLAWQPSATLPSSYFLDLAEQYERRMQQYRILIEEIEANLNSAAERRTYSPQIMSSIMRSQYDFYVAVTAQVAILHEQLATLKEQFLATYRVDVFADYDRKAQQASLSSIRVTIPPPSVFPGSTTATGATAATGTALTSTTAPAASSLFSVPAFGATTPAFPSSTSASLLGGAFSPSVALGSTAGLPTAPGFAAPTGFSLGGLAAGANPPATYQLNGRPVAKPSPSSGRRST